MRLAEAKCIFTYAGEADPGRIHIGSRLGLHPFSVFGFSEMRSFPKEALVDPGRIQIGSDSDPGDLEGSLKPNAKFEPRPAFNLYN